LLQRNGEAEMRVGVHTSAFGSIEVRTVVRDSQVGLSISSERGDLRTALAADLPAIENTLRTHQLEFSSVQIGGHSGGTGQGHGGGQPQSPRAYPVARDGESRPETPEDTAYSLDGRALDAGVGLNVLA
jgi:flagellar hook-length control protein FliK